jgi:UDP-N-acetylglucosamine 2-epimerase (non-hydrolysing)
MKAQLKVMTVGTRPESYDYQNMAALDLQAIEHIVHTGQIMIDYELNQIFFDLGIRKPDFSLNAAGASATETIGQILIKMIL